MSFDPMMLIGASGAGFGPLVSYMGGKKQIQAQQDINTQNIEESRRVMQQQREWALSDWDKVNSYNSPDQQMQRYMDAGLNPNLIYGNAQNSPSAMIKSPTQAAGRAEASGIVEGIGTISQGFNGAAQQAMNMYFANKNLENDTNLKNAQILNLKAQTDKNILSNNLTQTTFDDLIQKIKLENSLNYKRGSYITAQETNMPSPQAYQNRYSAETKRTLELLEMARKENILKQSDIDTMQRLSGTRGGDKMLFELAKMIIQGGINRYSK